MQETEGEIGLDIEGVICETTNSESLHENIRKHEPSSK